MWGNRYVSYWGIYGLKQVNPTQFLICSIKIYNLKRLYIHKHNNLNYLIYNDDCFNSKECDFKVKIVAVIWKIFYWKYYNCVLKYDCECIENIKSVKSKDSCIHFIKMNALTPMFMTMTAQIDKTTIVAWINQQMYYL